MNDTTDTNATNATDAAGDANALALARAAACAPAAVGLVSEYVLERAAFGVLLAAAGICGGLISVMFVLIVSVRRIERAVAMLRAENRSEEESRVVRATLLAKGAPRARPKSRARAPAPAPEDELEE